MDRDIVRRLRGASDVALSFARQAVLREAAGIDIAAASAVPTESGDLAGSRFVDSEVVPGERVTATVGYESEHAAFVHEGFHYGREKSAKPKWLEQTANSAKSYFAGSVAKAFRSALKQIAK